MFVTLCGAITACGFKAAKQDPSKPQVMQIAGGRFQASGVNHVAGTNGVLFIDDTRGRELFWMELGGDGAQKQPAVALPLNADISDPEGITTDGKFFYVVSSLSEPHAKTAPELIRFTFDAATRRVGQVAAIAGLGDFLQREVAELRDRGLNIEGLAWDAEGRRLLLGFRSPVIEGNALIVPLQLREASVPFTLANLAVARDSLIRLPLTGAGIRSLEYDAKERRFWLITDTPSNQDDWRLVEWRPGSAAVRELARFPANLKPEGITRASFDGTDVTLVVFDVGSYQVIR